MKLPSEKPEAGTTFYRSIWLSDVHLGMRHAQVEDLDGKFRLLHLRENQVPA